MTETSPQAYMAKALALAEKGRYTVSPNPMVACILVKNKQIVGQGFHQLAGEPHAEVLALREAGARAKGATAYVTLEPCCHVGRTPPCTRALIEAGIKTVYAACLDPNPVVAGQGLKALQAAGLEVKVGLLEAEATALNEIFFHYIKHKRPFVFAKWAMSLDGQTITQPEDSRQISCPEAHQHSHQLRRQVDAIIVGAQTALVDNPQLTVRIEETEIAKQPLRIILSSQGSLPLHLQLFDGSLPGKTLVATTAQAEAATCRALEKQGVEVLVLPETEGGQVSLSALLAYLGQKEITSVLVEGGRILQASFFNEGLVNKIQVYVAATVIASLKKKQVLNKMHWRQLGHDLSISADL